MKRGHMIILTAGILLGGCFATAGGLLSGLERLSLTPPAPVATQEHIVPARDSFVEIPVSASFADLERLADERIPEAVYDAAARPLDVPTGKAVGDLHVRRSGKATLRSDGKRLIFSIPLAFTSRIKWEAEFLGLRPSTNQTPSGAFILTISLIPSFTDDWELHTSPDISVEWKKKPSIELLNQTIGIAGLLEDLMQSRFREEAGVLDRVLNEQLRLRERAAEQWRALHSPIRIRSTPDVWLEVEPRGIYRPVVRMDQKTLTVTLGMVAGLRAAAGASPPERVETLLPKFSKGIPRSRGVDVQLRLSMPYDVINESLVPVWKGIEFHSDGARVTIRDLKISGNGDRLVVAADIKAQGPGFFSKAEGVIYLTGVPVLDRAAQMVRIDRFDFDPSTLSGLAARAAWLAKPTFVRSLQSRLAWSIARPLDDARSAVRDALSTAALDEHFVLTGTLDELTLDDITAQEDRLSVLTSIKGRLSVRYTP